MEAILGILISALLTQNFILVKFYGICPFMGVSKKIDTALGMGMAVTFVMALASAACYGRCCGKTASPSTGNRRQACK